MAAYAVVLISPPGYRHAEAFREVAQAVLHGLRELGHDAVLSDSPFIEGRTAIVFGANLLPDAGRLPPDAIVFNLEQVDASSAWIREPYLGYLRRHVVWDYSAVNVERLRSLGAARVRHVPVGHATALERIEPAGHKDIDVLFYGSMNARRAAAIDQVRAHGLDVLPAFGVYGAERDALIARARIVLNVHFYETRILEVVRIAYLLGNGACVVSEDGVDPLEQEFAGAMALVPHADLGAACADLLRRPDEMRRMREAGRALMRARPQARYLRDVVGPA